jgi:hypothetical protein
MHSTLLTRNYYTRFDQLEEPRLQELTQTNNSIVHRNIESRFLQLALNRDSKHRCFQPRAKLECLGSMKRSNPELITSCIALMAILDLEHLCYRRRDHV